MPANKMNKLLDKIERKIGTRALNLPDYLQKPKWATVIEDDTLLTWSRYFPNELPITLDLSQKKTNGYYVLDEYLPNGVEVIGVRDIDWNSFAEISLALQQNNGFGAYNFITDHYNIDSVALLQMRADHKSLFSNQIFVDFKSPNMVRVSNTMGSDITRYQRSVPIVVFIKHANNLMTISPTMMETFEDLAIADVATFLYEELKYFDGIETVFANTDLKIGDLADKMNKRDDIINYIKESYVSTANQYQPMIFTI